MIGRSRGPPLQSPPSKRITHPDGHWLRDPPISGIPPATFGDVTTLLSWLFKNCSWPGSGGGAAVDDQLAMRPLVGGYSRDRDRAIMECSMKERPRFLRWVKAGDWRVEWFDAEGGCEVKVFTGPDARERARQVR